MPIYGTQRTEYFCAIRRAHWLFLITGLLLSGCNSVWFDPYIDLPDRDLEKDYGQTNNFSQLLIAAVATETLRKTANSYREQLAVGRSILSYGTFGAAAAGGVAALYGANTDLVLGLGIGAVGAYSADSLFASTDRIDIYSAANRALNCVVGAADSAMATAKSLDQLITGKGTYLTNKNELDKLIAKFGISWPRNLLDPAQLAARRYEAALDNIAAFKALDPDLAVTVTRTRDIVIFTMEEKIRATQPGLGTILKVAQGIGVAGVAYMKQVTPPPPPGTGSFSGTISSSDTSRFISLTNRVGESATRINEAVTSSTNRMDQLGSICVLDLPSTTPLTISQTDVTLGKDQTVTLVSSGGKRPLTYTWQVNTPSSDEIEVILSSGKEIVLIGKAALPANTKYELIIRDSLAAPSEVLIKVKTP